MGKFVHVPNVTLDLFIEDEFAGMWAAASRGTSR
jgi:hypothetical protein